MKNGLLLAVLAAVQATTLHLVILRRSLGDKIDRKTNHGFAMTIETDSTYKKESELLLGSDYMISPDYSPIQ